jgi:transposase-like protein
MNLLEFQRTFPDEAHCEAYLIEKRWPNGFTCPHCANQGGWYLPARRSFECTACHKQQGITAGTIFHKTRTPLQEWFLALFLMASHKKGISGLQLQKDLGATYQARVYRIQRKIREAMAAREALYQLGGGGRSGRCFF